MLRRVVRGESAGGCVLEVVTVMGLDRGISGPRMVRVASSSGDAATEGPLGDEVRERCIAGVDLDAALARAAARCG